MSGSALSQLLDFYAVTGPAILTGPEAIVNEAQERSFAWSWLMSGNAENRLQGGQRIKDFIMFDAGDTARFYLPGASRTWSNPNVLDEHAIDWRFLEDHMAFIDAEIELQASGLSREAKFHTFKRILAVKEKRLATSLSNKMEAALFAQPNATTMEGTTATQTDPYSLFTFINEFGGTATDAGALAPGTGLPNGFTTIAGLSPTTETKWRCQQVSYTDADVTLTTANASAAGLLNAFTKMLLLTKYDELPYKAGEGTTNNPLTNDYCIFASLNGRTYFEKIQRASADHFKRYKTDPNYVGSMPDFAGVPMKYVSRMDTAAVYPSSGTTAPTVGSGALETAADISGPRYMWAAREWIKPIFHSSRYFHMRPEIVPSSQPDTTIKVAACWYNLFPRSRQKLGMVYPRADITL